MGSLGIYASSRSPARAVEVISRETIAVLDEPAIRERLRVLALIPDPGGPDHMRAAILRERAQFVPVVKALDLAKP